jgi:hypothetical protein
LICRSAGAKMHGLRGQTVSKQNVTEVNDQEKRLHQKKSNGAIPFGLIFLSVLSNLFSVDFRDTRAKLAKTNRPKISEYYCCTQSVHKMQPQLHFS